jgi:outer membrane lipoprotein-sorting protein
MISDLGFRISDLGKRTLVAVALVVLVASAASAQRLTAKQILAKAGANYDVVKDYVVDARLTVESPQMHVPNMQVKIFYKKPNKLHVDSKDGFAMLPRQGTIVGNPLKDMLSITDLAVARTQKVLGNDCYVVTGTIRKNDRSTEITVWIDNKNFLARQISTNPEWGPSISAKLWYVRVAGKYWMPSMTSAQISIPPLPEERVDTARKPGGPTTVTLKFSDYRVNTGISDAIFEKQEGGK